MTDIACHMGSDNVTYQRTHPTLINPSQ